MNDLTQATRRRRMDLATYRTWDLIVKGLLPVAVVVGTTVIAQLQKASDDQQRKATLLSDELQRNATLLSDLIVQLSSSDPRARQVAVEVLGSEAITRRFPRDAIERILYVAALDSVANVSNSAMIGLETLASADSLAARRLKSYYSMYEPTVRLYCNTGKQHEALKPVQAFLTDHGFDAAWPQSVTYTEPFTRYPPKKCELRCLHDIKEETDRLVQLLQACGIDPVVRDMSQNFVLLWNDHRGSCRARYYELWLGRSDSLRSVR